VKPQSLVFTIYGDYVLKNRVNLTFQSLVKMMTVFGFTEPAIRAALYRMKKKGIIKEIDGRIELSPEGLKRTMEGVGRVYGEYKHHWDGKWRILVYNLSEERRELRDSLRRELTWLGFGSLAQSTWISPNPVDDTLKEVISRYGSLLKERDHLFFFVATSWGDPQQIVRRCWNLSQIDQAYREFLSKWSTVDPNLDYERAFITKLMLVHEYRKFLNIDPMLPQELLPEDWIGYRAHELFVSLYSKLAPKADEYFTSMVKSKDKVSQTRLRQEG